MSVRRQPTASRPGRACTLAIAVAVLCAVAGATSASAAKVEVELDGLGGGGLGGISIPGLGSAMAASVRAQLSIAEADDPSADRIRQLHAEAPQEIQLALQPFGYYKPQITPELRQESADRFVARYRVDLGPLMRVAGVDLQVTGPGAADEGFRDLARDFPIRRGSPLLHAAYEAGKQALVEHAAAHGYLDATFVTHQIRVDLAAYTARVRLHFRTGPQYAFGPVSFDEAMIDRDVLAGYLPFETGEPFDLNKLLELQNALSSSLYFRRVEVVPEEEEARRAGTRAVPVHVLLLPARRERWQFGLGYGPDTGVRATVGVDLRRVNRRGHRAEVDTKVSQIESRFSATYIVPKAKARTDFTTYSLGYAELDSDSAQTRTAIAAVGLDRARGDWRERFSIGYQLEDFTVGPDSGTSELLMPQATWSQLRADNVLYPLSGRRLQLQLRGAADDTISNAQFAQATAEIKYVHSLWGPVRGLGRVKVGYLETNEFHQLPASIRFFAGGYQSVRGYGYQELTPRTADGQPLGGDTLVEASLEVDALLVEFKKLGRFGVAAFWDAGNAMDSFDLGDLRSGVGAGIRWMSPIGLVRADAAFALDLPGTPVRFQFSLGPDL